jgi:membrane associated rhomboid family serine protease
VPRHSDERIGFALPRPGRALLGTMLALLGIWLAFAVGLNWADASRESFDLLCGNTSLILQGQVWRIFTAPLLHEPQGTIGHILFALLGLFFFAPSLEREWGGARMLRFLAGSALIGYVLQLLVELALPGALAGKLVGYYWFGAIPVADAVAIAWALSFRGQTAYLFFFPVSSRMLILIVAAFNVLYVLAGALTQSGLVAPFGGMLAGWLLGGGTPSPLRRAWLRLRLRRLEQEARADRGARRARVQKSGLRVIDGGRSDKGGDDGDGPDGRMLN